MCDAPTGVRSGRMILQDGAFSDRRPATLSTFQVSSFQVPTEDTYSKATIGVANAWFESMWRTYIGKL
ncbi:unnamed protein product [Peniophora sp. CBMAI 1063]|nr:unnamed protein product [Peniophora sp. CBMAI 1063]